MVERLEIELRDGAFVPDDGVETLVRARRALHSQGMFGTRISSELRSVFLLIQRLLEFRRLCACFFRSRPERGTFFRCGILEQALMLFRSARRLSIWVFSWRTSASSAMIKASRSRLTPLSRIARSTSARLVLMKSSPSMAAALRELRRDRKFA